MDSSKVQLSEQEMDLVSGPGFILMKNGIITKVYECYGILAENMKAITSEGKNRLPEDALVLTPRISRGENYQGLPYVMLDYPRLFSTEHVFAIRTFFWWGKSFNITLHLKGRYQGMFSESLEKNLAMLKNSGFYISHTKDEWDHDILGAGYISLQQVTEEEFRAKLLSDGFIKIGTTFPIHQWNQATAILTAAFKQLIDCLNQFPRR